MDKRSRFALLVVGLGASLSIGVLVAVLINPDPGPTGIQILRLMLLGVIACVVVGHLVSLPIGSRSILYGAHMFFWHPLYVAWCWYKLFGFKAVSDPYVGRVSLLDPRLWVAFVVHDLGYIGKPNMDGLEGELHPATGARLMAALFDGWKGQRAISVFHIKTRWDDLGQPTHGRYLHLGPWGQFVFFHSRYIAREFNKPYSMLCVADKLAICEPMWLYLPRVVATGEVVEYMNWRKVPGSKYRDEPEVVDGLDNPYPPGSRRRWHYRMTAYCRAWAYEHRDGKQDLWTPTRNPA